MIEKEISAKVPGKGGAEDMAATIVVEYPETLEEAEEIYGQEAILSNAFANWKVTLQSNIRTSLKSGLNPAQVQDKLGTAKMGVAQVGGKVDVQAAFIAKLKMATPEEQENMIKALKEAAQL